METVNVRSAQFRRASWYDGSFFRGKCGYTTKNLKNKLLDHYGNGIFFNKLPGNNTMLASEKWHKNKNSNPEVESLSAFANDTKIIRSQFCGSVYILGEYPALHPDFEETQTLLSTILLSLQVTLLFMYKNTNDVEIIFKLASHKCV